MRRDRAQTMQERFLRTGPVEPVGEDRPIPFVRMVAAGLARFAGLVAVAGGLSVGAALLVAWLRGSDLLRAAILGLYLGGALLIALPLLGSGGRSFHSGGYVFYEDTDAASRRAWQGTLWAYLAVGVSLVGLGIALETIA